MIKKEILIILNILFCIFIVSAINDPYMYYKLNINYSLQDDKETISVDSLNIEFSSEKIWNKIGFYKIEVLDNDRKLGELYFDIPKTALIDYVHENTSMIVSGGEIILNETFLEIYIPYFSDAEEIVIYDDMSNEIVKIDVSMYSINKEKTIHKDDLMGYTDKTDSLENKNKSNLKYYAIFVMLVLLIILILIFIRNKKSKNKQS
jgi:hypothetical protein